MKKGIPMNHTIRKIIMCFLHCLMALSISMISNAAGTKPSLLSRAKAGLNRAKTTIGTKFTQARTSIGSTFTAARNKVTGKKPTPVKPVTPTAAAAAAAKAKAAKAAAAKKAGLAEQARLKALSPAEQQAARAEKKAATKAAKDARVAKAQTRAAAAEAAAEAGATPGASAKKGKTPKGAPKGTATTEQEKPAKKELTAQDILAQQLRAQQISGITQVLGGAATGITSAVLTGTGNTQAATAARAAGASLTNAASSGANMYYQPIPVSPDQYANLAADLTAGSAGIAAAATGRPDIAATGAQTAQTVRAVGAVADQGSALLALGQALTNLPKDAALRLATGFDVDVFDLTASSDGTQWTKEGDPKGTLRVGMVFNTGATGFGNPREAYVGLDGVVLIPSTLDKLFQAVAGIPGGKDIVQQIQDFTTNLKSGVTLPAHVRFAIRVLQLLYAVIGTDATMTPEEAFIHLVAGLYKFSLTDGAPALPDLRVGSRVSAAGQPSSSLNNQLKKTGLVVEPIIRALLELVALLIAGQGPLSDLVDYDLLKKHAADTDALGKVGDFIDAAWLTIASMAQGPVPGEKAFLSPADKKTITKTQAIKLLCAILLKWLKNATFDITASIIALNELYDLSQLGDLATLLAPFGDDIVQQVTHALDQAAEAQAAGTTEAPEEEAAVPEAVAPTPVVEKAAADAAAAVAATPDEAADLKLLISAAAKDPALQARIDAAATDAEMDTIIADVKADKAAAPTPEQQAVEEEEEKEPAAAETVPPVLAVKKPDVKIIPAPTPATTPVVPTLRIPKVVPGVDTTKTSRPLPVPKPAEAAAAAA